MTLSFISTRARSTGGVSIHEGKASAAARTAWSTVSAPQRGVSAMTSPIEGLWTGVVATPLTETHSPPINSGQESSLLMIFL